MLTEEEKNLMRRCLDAVRRSMPGFMPRQPQLRMMATVAHALAAIGDPTGREEGSQLAVIEAGTGKTLGYLLPALALAHLRGKHLVVASSTVALQEQLLHKDVPALRQCLPFDAWWQRGTPATSARCGLRVASVPAPRRLAIRMRSCRTTHQTELPGPMAACSGDWPMPSPRALGTVTEMPGRIRFPTPTARVASAASAPVQALPFLPWSAEDEERRPDHCQPRFPAGSRRYGARFGAS